MGILASAFIGLAVGTISGLLASSGHPIAAIGTAYVGGSISAFVLLAFSQDKGA